jgi:hypothetical protein
VFEDEYGNKYSECINCERVYLVLKSPAELNESFCSSSCEDENKAFVYDLYEMDNEE